MADKRYVITRYLAGDPTSLHNSSKSYNPGNFIRNIITGDLFYTVTNGVHVCVTKLQKGFSLVVESIADFNTLELLDGLYNVTGGTTGRLIVTPKYNGETLVSVLQQFFTSGGMKWREITISNPQIYPGWEDLISLLNNKLNSHERSSDYVETYTTSCDDISKYKHNRNCIIDISSTVPFNGDNNFVLTQTWIDAASKYYQMLISSTGKKYSRIFYMDEELTFPWTTIVSDDNIAPKASPEFTGTIKLNGKEIYADGTNYLIVYGTGTPTENAAELQAAYEAAKKMPRYLGDIQDGTDSLGTIYKGQTFFSVDNEEYCICNEDYINVPLNTISNKTVIPTEAEAKSVRTTVIVAPGVYTFPIADSFDINTPYIDIVSLTGNRDVQINGCIVSAGANVYLKGINAGTDKIIILNSTENSLIFENCIALGTESFSQKLNANGNLYGTFIECEGGISSFNPFNGDIDATSKFVRCKSLDGSFGGTGYSTLDIYGYFEDCEGRSNCFGYSNRDGAGHVTAIFKRCKATNYSFGNNCIITGSKFIECEVEGDNSFGSGDTEYVGSSINNTEFFRCIAFGNNNFGSGNCNIIDAKLSYCYAYGQYNFGFGATANGSKYYYCNDDYDGINTGITGGMNLLYCIHNRTALPNIDN